MIRVVDFRSISNATLKVVNPMMPTNILFRCIKLGLVKIKQSSNADR